MTKPKATGRSNTGQKKAAGKPSLRARFKFGDTAEAFEIDALDLTVGEQIEIEEFFGKPWNRIMTEGWLLGSVTGKVFLAFLARRRKQPNFTHAEALEFNPVISDPEEDDEDRPTNASKSDGSQP
jgi:hypothetical protein